MTPETVAVGAGCGPFKLDSYVPDTKVSLTANSTYWDGAPHVAGIDRPVIVDASTRHAEYLHGDLDMLQYLQPGNLVTDQNDASLKGQIQFYPRASTWYIGLNQKAFPAFKDVRVRQALAYATDKSLIVQRVFQASAMSRRTSCPKASQATIQNSPVCPMTQRRRVCCWLRRATPAAKASRLFR